MAKSAPTADESCAVYRPASAPRSRPRRKPSEAARQRAQAILRREIDFIFNEEFERSELGTEVLDDVSQIMDRERQEVNSGESSTTPPAGLPPYLANLYRTPLLSANEEAALFRAMNYLKYRANLIRCMLDTEHPDLAAMDEFDRLIELADTARDRLIRANLRLVVSIARRFTSQYNSFDELVSDGNLTMMHAIEKFDYARGFRFSTYATHAVQRTFFRRNARKIATDSHVTFGADELLCETPDEYEPEQLGEETFVLLKQLLGLMNEHLDEREQFILSARFGLGRNDGGQTLQQVAEQIDICKERVRQLQHRAIDKLRKLAEEYQLPIPSAWVEA